MKNNISINQQLLEQLESLSSDELAQWMFLKKQTANAYFKIKQYKTAIETYTKALIPIDHNLLDVSQRVKQQLYFPVLLNVATCLYSMKQYLKALEYTDRIIKQRGNHSQTFQKKANILLKLGKEQQAKQSFLQAIRYTVDSKILNRVKQQIHKLQSVSLASTTVSQNGCEQNLLIQKPQSSNDEQQIKILIYKQTNILKRVYQHIRKSCGKFRIGDKWKRFKGYFTLFDDDD